MAPALSRLGTGLANIKPSLAIRTGLDRTWVIVARRCPKDLRFERPAGLTPGLYSIDVALSWYRSSRLGVVARLAVL